MECSCGGLITRVEGRLICANCGIEYGEPVISESVPSPPPSDLITSPPPPDPVPPLIEETDQYEFSVLPFVANVANNQGSAEAAAQLESAINSAAQEGWEYMRLETVETYIAGTPSSSGCLGFGETPATPGSIDHFKMIVVRRKK